LHIQSKLIVGLIKIQYVYDNYEILQSHCDSPATQTSSTVRMCTNIMLKGDICSNRLSNKQLFQDPQYQQDWMVLSWREWENTGKRDMLLLPA